MHEHLLHHQLLRSLPPLRMGLLRHRPRRVRQFDPRNCNDHGPAYVRRTVASRPDPGHLHDDETRAPVRHSQRLNHRRLPDRGLPFRLDGGELQDRDGK